MGFFFSIQTVSGWLSLPYRYGFGYFLKKIVLKHCSQCVIDLFKKIPTDMSVCDS